jgi:hypothetical protein
LKGILTRDYYDEQTEVQLNTPLSVDFEQARCDPFYGEHFETFRLGKIDEAGWLQWREAGSLDWEVYRDENSLGQSARIGSYRSGDETSISWLISPEWDLRSLSNFGGVWRREPSSDFLYHPMGRYNRDAFRNRLAAYFSNTGQSRDSLRRMGRFGNDYASFSLASTTYLCLFR